MSRQARQRTSIAVPALFDMNLRALRRDRAARLGPETFLYERVFADCLERIGSAGRRFERLLLVGCPDPAWPERLNAVARVVEVYDPGPLFAERAGGRIVIEDHWHPPEAAFDAVLTIGTLDTVNDLRLALRLLRHGMTKSALLIGAMSGGDTLPELRQAMRAADALTGVATPHVHPRIEAAALAPLLAAAGFLNPVVDVDRAAVSYASFDRLIGDLRAMATTNILAEAVGSLNKGSHAAAAQAFVAAGDGKRTIETFEILHIAAWTADG